MDGDLFWRIYGALLEAPFIALLGWLAYQWVFNHDAVCAKCRQARQIEEVHAAVTYRGDGVPDGTDTP